MTSKVYSVKISLNLMKIQTIASERFRVYHLIALKLEVMPLFYMRKGLSFSNNTHKASFCTKFLIFSVMQETIKV